MSITSPCFQPVSLSGACNLQRGHLAETLRPPRRFLNTHGTVAIRGVPFDFGSVDRPDVILLERDDVAVDLDGAQATYILIVHAVEDIATNYQSGFAQGIVDGVELGNLVSEYRLEHADGSMTVVPVLRRFAIQQARYQWGSTPFACVPAADDVAAPSAEEMQLAGQAIVEQSWMASNVGLGTSADDFMASIYGARQLNRVESAVEWGGMDVDPATEGRLWIYALPNPKPSLPLRRMLLRPRSERSTVYAVSLTELDDHPLLRLARQKLRLRLPDAASSNAITGGHRIRIDLGNIISVRPALDYNETLWRGDRSVTQPRRSEHSVIVEYTAHPAARLYVDDRAYPVSDTHTLIHVASTHRPVRLKFLERISRARAAVRLHLHGQAGEYLPPRGHHRSVSKTWGRDLAAEFVNGENQYAYIDGECEADLPLGTVYIEASRGYEVAPIRTSFEVTQDTEEIIFELDRVIDWRSEGWVTADTHVHFLSPQTAILEGRAEGVNVINLLAAQWGEMFSNVGDFDGKTTFGADHRGAGEFMVRVGSENRMNALGHISLLGYSGALIHPLSTGGPEESALGDPLQSTMAEWARRCLDQGGLVVLPHAPKPQLERAADIVLGLVEAVELMTTNPLHPDGAHLNPYGIADWYRYLNLGYHLPIVGGSDKMSPSNLLGGIRTYTWLGEQELTYDNWLSAVRAGNTFATVGPLTRLSVEGRSPGDTLKLPSTGGRVEVEWQVESVRMPINRVEVIVGGLIVDDIDTQARLSAAGRTSISVDRSTWIALRVRGSHRAQIDDVAAHTSAVMVQVGSSEPFSEHDSQLVLDQIRGALAYVDTLATRPEARRFQQLRATLETAYNRLHQRMHAAGIYHHHAPHDHDHEH